MPSPTPPDASLSKTDYETLAEFRYALRLFLHFSEEAATEAGLSPQQHQALLAIQGFPGRDRISVGELAERLQIRHHSAVGLVDRLAKEGWVKRIASPEDARKVFLAVTPRGLRVLAALSTAHRQELRRIGPSFRDVLERLIAP